jgi:hypothetical protein
LPLCGDPAFPVCGGTCNPGFFCRPIPAFMTCECAILPPTTTTSTLSPGDCPGGCPTGTLCCDVNTCLHVCP